MFNTKRIEELEKRIKKLETYHKNLDRKIAKAEHPFEFDYLDTVKFKCGDEYKIGVVLRMWFDYDWYGNHTNRYDILVEGEEPYNEIAEYLIQKE